MDECNAFWCIEMERHIEGDMDVDIPTGFKSLTL